MVVVKSIPLKNLLLLAFYQKKIFLQVTQKCLEEVISSFIILQIAPLFHLDQQNIQVYVKITLQVSRLFTKGNFRARVFLPLLSQRKIRDSSLPRILPTVIEPLTIELRVRMF